MEETGIMRATFTAIWALCALGGVGGCGEIGAIAPGPAGTATGSFDGTWAVLGRTRTASPDADENCGYGTGTGTLKIQGGRVNGELKDNSGYAYVLEGTIDASGTMRGAFTYEGYDAATFEGVLSSEAGSGSWTDIYGCPGAWETARQGTSVAHDGKDPTPNAPSDSAG